MITTALIALGCLAIGELIAIPAFARIRQIYAPKLQGERSQLHVALTKGVLERTVLFLGLLLNFAVILAAFGAFKLGTRLKDDTTDPVSNDYFLVGNMASLLIVLIDVVIFRWVSVSL